MGWGKSTGVGVVVECPGYVELGDDIQGVGEGECRDKEEVRDGRGGEGEGIRFGAQWTPAGTPAGGHQLGRSRHPLPCSQVNYTIDLQLLPKVCSIRLTPFLGIND